MATTPFARERSGTRHQRDPRRVVTMMARRREPSPRKPLRNAARRPWRPGLDRLDGRLLLSVVGAIPIDGATATSSTAGSAVFSAGIDDYAGDIRVVIDWGD